MVVGHREPVVIISHDIVSDRMAGPGIRYFHLARVLAHRFQVTLAVPEGSTISGDFFTLVYHSGTDELLGRLIGRARVVIVPAVYAAQIPALWQSEAFIVVDGYDPFIAESLFLGVDILSLQINLTKTYLLGDFFICASERQRDWWLGLLEAHGRINPYTFGEDPSLRKLVDVVPFGLLEEPPQATRPIIKGVWPGIGPEDKVILWGGGLWPWLDPLTAIRAMARVWQQRQDVRLIFPGTRHPNPWMSGIPTHNEAAQVLAGELGLLGKAVFFGEWVPYKDWPNVLLESDLALTLHLDTLEARLAFRSRVLDYIWAGLPIIATRGDATSDLVDQYRLGIVVDYADDAGVANAILQLLETPKEAWHVQFEKARRDLTWERVAQPLVEFCCHPRRAPDKVALGDRLGNPYYIHELTRLHALIAGYEQGLFIRMMRLLHRLSKHL
ncbi:Glycosyltransferase involved in cell wall bisynthesis [Thermoflexus hugenholtzii JAD2]|uniref:Glycosyltransferase involved in cell wall bisynthesis n=1 Tax=Thermoflexus hugenholtzii JAD2 TaxID=877466 RepID=A0A212RHS3_9CHLR|nr:Glycosyltransferase involved in cell wall bisynthesis [Thermoflexus hugenholtzii JAD2]